MNRRQRTPNGFTLVELLIVIAIITILAAMLLPTLEKALESSRRIQCSNNLHQMYLGATSYAMDFNDSLPTTVPWEVKFSSSLGYPCWYLSGNGWWYLLYKTDFKYLDYRICACLSMSKSSEGSSVYWNGTAKPGTADQLVLPYDYRYNANTILVAENLNANTNFFPPRPDWSDGATSSGIPAHAA